MTSSFSQFVCLSGLPRSGSTLLSALLSQNPTIHAEGNSAVCQLMWDMQQSCVSTAKEQLLANNRQSTIKDIISQIPHIYYKNNPPQEKIVVDKCRSWTIPANIDLLRNYIDTGVKIIVLERSVLEIVASFVKLYKDNHVDATNLALLETKLIAPSSEPIMRSIAGINWAKRNNQNNTFIFINYDELINDTAATIAKIYTFCGWQPFAHDFTNVVIKYHENDEVYGLRGQHKIRKTIKKRENSVVLSEDTIRRCKMIDNLIKNS